MSFPGSASLDNVTGVTVAHRLVCLLSVSACGNPPPAPAAPTAPRARAVSTAIAEQRFADDDQGFGFAEPDRRARLEAALASLDPVIDDEMTKQALRGLAIGVVIDGELAYAKGLGVTDIDSGARPTPD